MSDDKSDTILFRGNYIIPTLPITTVSIGEPQPYVPLRKCQNLAADKDGQFLCSECRDSLWTGLDNNEIRYCPNCGAKVVDE